MIRLSQLINRLFDSPGLSLMTRPEYKRIQITAYLSLLCILVAVAYSVADLSSGVLYSAPSYGILITGSVFVFILLKKNRFVSAKILLMITINLVVFYASVADPMEAGTYLLFIPAGVTSFSVMGFQDRSKSYYMAVFTSVLFFISFFGDINLGNARPSEAYIQLSFVINYVISITGTILAFYFLIELNAASERELISKERTVSEKNQELTKVNQELDRFVYSVSHDLRSPLSSILGITNIARHESDKDQLLHYMKLIEGRVKAQDQFIREIIDYSRNVRTSVERNEVLFSEVMSEIVEALHYQPGTESISFTIDDPNRVKLYVDRTRLRIIFSNLITNAIKYQDITKSRRAIDISIQATDSGHTITVRDNGIGIASEHVPKIFNMFYRASENSTGSGLGLFITQEAVDKIGGTISVESKIGVGSRFIVNLPS